MFDKTDVEKYRSIKAPSELRDKILHDTSAYNKKRYIPKIKAVYAVAACLLLFVVCSVFLRNPVTITVTDPGVLTASARESISTEIIIEKRGSITIEALDEGFYIVDAEKTVPLVDLYKTKDKIKIAWISDGDEAELKINGKKYKVFYSANESKIIVEK